MATLPSLSVSFSTSLTPVYTVQAPVLSANQQPANPVKAYGNSQQSLLPLPAQGSLPFNPLQASLGKPTSQNEQALAQKLPEEHLLLRSRLRYKTFAQQHPRGNRLLLASGALALFVVLPALLQSTVSNGAHFLMHHSTRYLDKTPWVNGALSKAHKAFLPKSTMGLLSRIALLATTLWGLGTVLNRDATPTTNSPSQWWWLPEAKESKTGLINQAATVSTS